MAWRRISLTARGAAATALVRGWSLGGRAKGRLHRGSVPPTFAIIGTEETRVLGRAVAVWLFVVRGYIYLRFVRRLGEGRISSGWFGSRFDAANYLWCVCQRGDMQRWRRVLFLASGTRGAFLWVRASRKSLRSTWRGFGSAVRRGGVSDLMSSTVRYLDLLILISGAKAS